MKKEYNLKKLKKRPGKPIVIKDDDWSGMTQVSFEIRIPIETYKVYVAEAKRMDMGITDLFELIIITNAVK